MSVYEEQVLHPNNGLIGIYDNYCFAQTFTAESAHDVAYIEIRVGSSGIHPPLGDLIVGLYATDIYSYPTGSALRSFTIAAADIPDVRAWTYGSFAAYTLTQGIVYAVIFSSPDSTDLRLPSCQFSYDLINPYLGGLIFESNDYGTSWEPSESYQNFDFCFRIWDSVPYGTEFNYVDVNGDRREILGTATNTYTVPRKIGYKTNRFRYSDAYGEIREVVGDDTGENEVPGLIGYNDEYLRYCDANGDVRRILGSDSGEDDTVGLVMI